MENKPTKTNPKLLSGFVVSTDAALAQGPRAKTLVVRVDRLVKHTRYGKYLTRSKRYLAHDEAGRFKNGDQVQIVETRPYSRRKHFKVV